MLIFILLPTYAAYSQNNIKWELNLINNKRNIFHIKSNLSSDIEDTIFFDLRTLSAHYSSSLVNSENIDYFAYPEDYIKYTFEDNINLDSIILKNILYPIIIIEDENNNFKYIYNNICKNFTNKIPKYPTNYEFSNCQFVVFKKDNKFCKIHNLFFHKKHLKVTNKSKKVRFRYYYANLNELKILDSNKPTRTSFLGISLFSIDDYSLCDSNFINNLSNIDSFYIISNWINLQ